MISYWQRVPSFQRNFELAKIESYTAKFYRKYYEGGDDPAYCGNPGGPFTLKLFEFTLPSPQSQEYVQEVVYTLPTSMMKELKKLDKEDCDDEENDEEEADESDEEKSDKSKADE